MLWWHQPIFGRTKVISVRMVIGLALAASASSGALGQTAAPASAQPAQAAAIPRAVFITSMDAEYKKMDVDKNGLVTRKEIEDFQRSTSVLAARQRNAGLFQALDKDRNGQISAGEFAGLPMNLPQPNAAPELAQVDRNRDGQATIIEYRAGKLVNFDQMDSDKDGVVSVAEMRTAGVIK